MREVNDRMGIGYALNGLGLVAWRRGDLVAAQAQLEESLRLYQEVGDKRYIAFVYKDLGQLAHARGEDGERFATVPQSAEHISGVGRPAGPGRVP